MYDSKWPHIGGDIWSYEEMNNTMLPQKGNGRKHVVQ